MNVHINEVENQVDVVDGTSLINPKTLNLIVAAVIRELERRGRLEAARKGEIDIRPIVEQQRLGGR